VKKRRDQPKEGHQVATDREETAARQALCDRARELIGRGDYDACEQMIRGAMGAYPHAPQPHNLLGILLEARGEGALAMKHYRAAWALDPTYLPVRRNLDNCATFAKRGRPAYDDSDCALEPAPRKLEIAYDPYGVGHVEKVPR
jgi:Tfp pilus assembly protein PilF